MVELSDKFPHIQLRLAKEGIAATPMGVKKEHPTTSANENDRQGHGSRLKSSLNSLISYWQNTQERREEEAMPPLPEKTIPIILQIDPTALQAEDLKTYGIEVIAELENGYIIGASVEDTDFTELQKKIEKFIKAERGGGKVKAIWDFIDGSKRPEYILSPELLNEWQQIRDERIYTVNIGIACLGTKSQLSDFPRIKATESEERFTKRFTNWSKKRDLNYQQWKKIKLQRKDEFTQFIQAYKGEILNIVDGDIPEYSQLLDSFSCCLQISGNGLKDLVLNFPYTFEVSFVILENDATAFGAEALRNDELELIAEIKYGYIIGASADLELGKLRDKIAKIIREEYNAGKVADLWDVIGGTQPPQYILSAELMAHWDLVKDDQIYTLDVVVSCVGIKSQLPDSPNKQPNEDLDSFINRVNNWINNRQLTYREWEEIAWQRQDEFEFFIHAYQGSIIKGFQEEGGISGTDPLPDSFSCRIQISGKGLKDLVFNFPCIFDVIETDVVAEIIQQLGLSEVDASRFRLEPPESTAPKVCVIDSGLQERHSFLKAAIESQSSRSWVPGETNKTSDYVHGGHGTRVAGAVLYPIAIPRTGQEKAVCWIQNARVLDANCKLPTQLFPPNLLGDIVEFYHSKTKTRIFNHSLSDSVPCRTRYMSAWAAAIDNLTWENDILFIVAAGNLPLSGGRIGYTRLSVQDHLAANRLCPDYLLEDSCRIANPAQSFQALTVGSVSLASYHALPYSSISEKDKPSAFSCSGLGIWDTIKPEVVEYGGDLVKDESIPPNITYPKEVCPELVRSTLNGGPGLAADKVGTSYATPKVSHIAACLAAELPDESCLLYRALIVQSARWPKWAEEKLDTVRQIGYGIPNIDRALGNSPNRITLITRGNNRIKARQAHVYQVKLPDKLRSQGEQHEILVEVTLSYKAQPRRTRRNRRKYLSTWLDWDCSKKGEYPENFLARILKKYDAPEDTEKGEGSFKWTIGKRAKNSGKIEGVSRSAGTVQKDWTVVKSFELTEAFCIAVVGHEGWNNDPDAEAPYSLVISFEAIASNIPIYTPFVEAQVEIELEQQVEINSI
ncbi:S8 family peptidase [Microcoleus vaginatus]|uniref:S8 family peptidase n=1 Tax=Microcoleus vaginatus TaxID=119532 RepID=UPI0032AC6A4D